MSHLFNPDSHDYGNDNHYIYGNAYIQPVPAYYNAAWMHRNPPRRDLYSLLEFYDDGSAYIPANRAGDANQPVVRSVTAQSIINIETLAFKSLRIKLYRMKEEDDTDILLELGKRYSVTYMTEGGMAVATGILKIIDQSIPDTCTRYVGEFNETVATAFIGLDCSTEGNSKKIKIFIASIRGIEEAPIDDPNYIPPEVDSDELTDAQKIQKILEKMPILDNKLTQILAKVIDNDQIIDRLNELDPTEKLNALVELFNGNTDSIISAINQKGDLVITKVNETHSTAMAKLEELLSKLGSMPYDDKINYIYGKMMDLAGEAPGSSGTVRPVSEVVATTEQKVDRIVDAIENGVQLVFLD